MDYYILREFRGTQGYFQNTFQGGGKSSLLMIWESGDIP